MRNLDIWACCVLLRRLVQVGVSSWLNLALFYELQMTLVNEEVKFIIQFIDKNCSF